MTKETYQRSVDILLDAYNKEQLFHGKCSACAVGNLLGTAEWSCLFYYGPTSKEQRDFSAGIPTDKLKSLQKLFYKKGFTQKELMKIELAFEGSIAKTEQGYYYYADDNIKKGQYIGLCAVLDIMKDMIEEPIQQEQIDQNQNNLNIIYNNFITV